MMSSEGMHESSSKSYLKGRRGAVHLLRQNRQAFSSRRALLEQHAAEKPSSLLNDL